MIKKFISVAILTLFLVPTAHAACESSKRLHGGFAQCLEAQTWQTSCGWLCKEHHFKARNRCHDLGKLVAKVDIRNENDVTWTFPIYDTSWKQGVNSGVDPYVRGVYCCTDLSELCNPSDLVNVADCTARWEESSAHGTCMNVRVQAFPDQSDCQVNADCRTHGSKWIPTSAKGHYHKLYTLKNCDGHLKWRNF